MERSDRVERASTLLAMERADAAEPLIREHLVHAPEDSYGWQLLSHACCDQDKYDEAIRAARQAITLAPDDDIAHFHLGRAQLCKSQYGPALDTARQAIALDPNQPRHHALLARALHLLDRDKEAYDAATAGLALAPDDAELLQLSGYAMMYSGRLKEARAVKNKVLHADPSGSASHHLTASTALHAARYREAEKHYREALRLEPASVPARNGMLEVLRARFLPYRVWQMLALYQMRTSRFIFIAWVLGAVVLIAVAGSIPVIGLYISFTLIALLILLVIVLRVGHIFAPIADAVIMLKPFGRSLLDRGERHRAFLAVTCIIICLGHLTACIITRRQDLLILIPTWFAMLVLVAWLGATGKRGLDTTHAAITAAFALLAIIASVTLPFGGEIAKAGVACAILFIGGFVGYFWVRPWVFH